MDIIKFTEYLKEAISIPPVLDIVIDDNGIVYDGRKLTDNSPLLTKGITKKIKTTKKERSDDQIHNDNFIKDNTIRRFKCRILRKRNILV